MKTRLNNLLTLTACGIFLAGAASTHAALIYTSDFESYNVGAAITINNTGDDNTFSLDNSNTYTAQANTGLALASLSGLPAGWSTGNRSMSLSQASATRNLIQQYLFTTNPSVMVVSMLWEVPASAGANLSVHVVDSAGARQSAASLAQVAPGTAGTLSRFTMVMNNSGGNIVLPGSNTLASGSFANYRTLQDGSIANYSSLALTAPNVGNDNYAGFAIRQGTGAVSGYYDNVMVWDSASDTLNGVSVLSLPVIPEPSTWALLAASLTALTVFRRRRS